MKAWRWHPEGNRAFIVDDEGFTVCEIVCPGQNNRAEVARQIVEEHNAQNVITEYYTDRANSGLAALAK